MYQTHFNNSKYTRWYFALVESRAKLEHRDGYFERHHIVPRSIGGSDDASNLVKLTAREHFIAHLLLSKMCLDKDHINRMHFAIWNMVNRDRGGKTTSRIFEILRKAHSKFLSERMRGEGNPNYGKVMSNEEKQKRSDKLKGVAKPEGFREKISVAMSGNKNPRFGKRNSRKQREEASNRLRENNPSKREDVRQAISDRKSKTINCFDLATNKFVQITKELFLELRNIRYVGNTSTRIPKNTEVI